MITEEEFEAMEEERKAEATQVVQELETAETAAVTQLLTEILLDEPSTGAAGAGVLGQGSKETGGGVMKMVAVSPEAVVESGENVTVVGDQGLVALAPGAVHAEVPAEVVQLASQLAGATGATNGSETSMILITITELSNDVADKLRSDNARITAQGRRLASSLKTLPINMKLRTAEGEELRISGLNQPIVFMLPIDNDTTDVPTCAFWDEELAIWSTEGVSTLPSTTPGKVLCSTTHLSIFGGVFEVLVGDMAQVLRCSTAFVVFSADGLLNLFKTEWLWQGPSLVTFSLLLLLALFFLISLHMDRRDSRYLPDKDKEAAFWPLKEPNKEEVEGDDLESAQLDEEKRKTCCSGGCKESTQTGCEWLLWCVGLLFGFENLAEVVKELLPNAAVGVVDRCIEQIHAHKTGTSRDSLHAVGDITKVLAGEDRIDSSQPTHSVQAKRQSLTETEINNQWKWAVDTFFSSSWFARLRLLFRALHPWAENTRISIFTSHTTRTTLIIMKLISAAAAAALFFSSEAETPDSDPECEQPEELWREMVQNVTVGVLSAFLGDAVIFFLFFVQLRQPKPEVEWTDELKENYRRRWRCRSVVFWSISIVHIGACVLYCLSFLANVSVEDAAEWLESCGVTLLQDLIILPLLMALVLASLATLAVTCSRKVHRSYWIPEDIGDAPNASDAPDLEGPQCIGFTAPTEDDWFVAQIPAVTEEDHSDEDSEGPVIVKNVDSDSCAGSLIQESIITEIRV